MSERDRDELRKQAMARGCTPYLLLPKRSEAEARREIGNATRG